MKKNQKKSGQKQTLLNYFSKVGETKKPQPKTESKSVASLVKSTSTIDLTAPVRASTKHSTASVHLHSKTFAKPVRNEDSAIDLTVDTVDLTSDTDSQPTQQQEQEQPQYDSSQPEEIKNTSKYTARWWTPDVSTRGPLLSSQESFHSSTQDDDVSISSSFTSVRVTEKRKISSVNTSWVGPNDVQPFSSNHTPVNGHRYGFKPRRSIPVKLLSATAGRRNEDNYADLTLPSLNDFSSSPHASSVRQERSVVLGTSKLSDFAFGNYGGTANNNNKSSSNNYGDSTGSNKRPRFDQSYSSSSISSSSSSHSSAFSGLLSNHASKQYRPNLSNQQKKVLNMVVNEKKNIFFTGSAGTGKSVLLRAIIEALQMKYGSQVAITASTGIAACNINGCTLHSFGGIGIGSAKVSTLIENIKNRNKRAAERWTSTRVLIIDEISMVDADLFDKLNTIAKNLRGELNKPFGGIQLIVTGDFFQLPPVSKDRAQKFAFESNAWSEVITETVMLTEVFRQKDENFVKILNEMRLGTLSPEAIDTFTKLSRKPQGDDTIEPTELYPLRHQVDMSNKRRLDALPGKCVEFRAIDKGDQQKIATCIAPEVIQLKKHAQVMLLKNVDAELVNGSLGIVLGFVGQGEFKDPKTLDNMRAPNRSVRDIMEDPLDMQKPYPVVQFTNGVKMVIEYDKWQVELPGGKVIASRTQLPIMLAWAISIHKSQGQTLDRVKVDLGKVFEKGQAYVALSRATSLNQLQILNFDPTKVMAHPRVSNFYKSLKTIA